jgi:hypothetical protein
MWSRSERPANLFGVIERATLSLLCGLALGCAPDHTARGVASDSGGASGTGGAVAVGTAGSGGVGTVAFGGASSGGMAGALGNAGSGAVAGRGGAAGNPSANPCAPRPGLLFCDDFEAVPVGGMPDSLHWSTQLNGDGPVAVDATTPAHSGSKSVHITGSGFQALLVFHDPAILPVASGRFYVRTYMRLGAAMTEGHNTFIIGDTFAAPGAGNATRVGEMNNMLMLTVGGDAHGFLSNQNFYNDHLPGVAFTPGAWACLEMLFDSPHTEIDTWVDGREVPDLHPTDLAHENYDALRFGFEKYAGPVSDIWYDDIAFGTQPIGCP